MFYCNGENPSNFYTSHFASFEFIIIGIHYHLYNAEYLFIALFLGRRQVDGEGLIGGGVRIEVLLEKID